MTLTLRQKSSFIFNIQVFILNIMFTIKILTFKFKTRFLAEI